MMYVDNWYYFFYCRSCALLLAGYVMAGYVSIVHNVISKFTTHHTHTPYPPVFAGIFCLTCCHPAIYLMHWKNLWLFLFISAVASSIWPMLFWHLWLVLFTSTGWRLGKNSHWILMVISGFLVRPVDWNMELEWEIQSRGKAGSEEWEIQ